MLVRLVPVWDSQVDPEAADRSIRRLRAELSELDLESVDVAPRGPVPVGAKATDPVTFGAVVVALSAAGGVLPTLIGVLRDWLGRQPHRHRIAMTIDGDTIELDGASDAVQRQLVGAYLRRHTNSSGAREATTAEPTE